MLFLFVVSNLCCLVDSPAANLFAKNIKMFSNMVKPGVFKHITCRNNIYPKSDVARFIVPDEFVFWSNEFKEYNPPKYTSKSVIGQIWADQQIETFQPQWNSLDGQIDRVSHMSSYEINESGYPLNPIGRTGLRGRGLLGRWGPNHAADPIVTRWKRTIDGDIIKNVETNKNILQMVAIQRHDNKMWAIPGGMVDPGEKVSTTLKREFMEEALDNFENKKLIEDFFAKGKEIYKGYVDDFRNTDNSWIETVAYNFHDDTGTEVGKLKLSAGDDAMNVRWQDINSEITLHANHGAFVKAVADLLNAHW